MKGYIFYSKADPKQEAIGSWPASSREDAFKNFAQIKKLPLTEFKRLFEVKLYDQTQTNNSNNS